MRKKAICVTLVSHNEKVCTGREMAEALAKVELDEADAAAWYRDLQIARKTFKAPRNKQR
jgi:hypothetical protein